MDATAAAVGSTDGKRLGRRALIPCRVDQICMLSFHFGWVVCGDDCFLGVAGKLEMEERKAQKSY
jgi:hypothetical protein